MHVRFTRDARGAFFQSRPAENVLFIMWLIGRILFAVSCE